MSFMGVKSYSGVRVWILWETEFYFTWHILWILWGSNSYSSAAEYNTLYIKVNVPCNRPKGPKRGRGIALLFLDLDARRGWVVSVTPRPFYPREKPGSHCTGGWVGPRANLDVCEKSHPYRLSFLVASHYTNWAIPVPTLNTYNWAIWNMGLRLACKSRALYCCQRCV
jgi:hypothetical protein